jgi:hypothetical protein
MGPHLNGGGQGSTQTIRDPLVIVGHVIDDLENLKLLAEEGLASPGVHYDELLGELREAYDGITQLKFEAANRRGSK